MWFMRLSLSDVEQMPARRLSDPVLLCIDVGGGSLRVFTTFTRPYSSSTDDAIDKTLQRMVYLYAST